jgi:hypothetical protein
MTQVYLNMLFKCFYSVLGLRIYNNRGYIKIRYDMNNVKGNNYFDVPNSIMRLIQSNPQRCTQFTVFVIRSLL